MVIEKKITWIKKKYVYVRTMQRLCCTLNPTSALNSKLSVRSYFIQCLNPLFSLSLSLSPPVSFLSLSLFHPIIISFSLAPLFRLCLSSLLLSQPINLSYSIDNLSHLGHWDKRKKEQPEFFFIQCL